MTSRSDPGCVRARNEDVVRADPELGLLVVADGMGGHNAGEVAARIAVECVEEKLRHALQARPPAPEALGELLREALRSADRRIQRQSEADRAYQHMGTTIACVLLHDDRAHVAHLGDSRVYRLRGGKLQLLTRDHTVNQEARDSGHASDAELAASHNRHLVTAALGTPEGDAVVLRELPVEPGDLFLVCSDGLNDMVDGLDIELVLDTMHDNLDLAADQLVMIARDCGGHDNISVALVRIDAPFPAAGGASLLARFGKWLRRSN